MKEIKLKNKKVLILGIVAIITVILLVAGSAYAFFVAQSNSGSEAKLNTTTGTTDSLTFNTTTSISINATQNNFGQNKGNLKGSTSAVATLKANSTTNQAKEKYNLFFIISTNDFVYSTGTKKAELLLKVTDPAGKEVTNITGLIKTPDGFDITTRTGGFAIVNDYEIVSTGTKIDDWKFEVTLVNLDTDQKLNESKTFSGRVFITQEPYKTYELAKINNINATKTTDSLALNADVTEGTAPVTKYYFGIEESTKPIALLSNKVRKLNNTVAALNQVSFVESITPSHKFTTLKDNTDYKIYSYAVDKEGIKSNTYETVLKTETYVLPTVTNVTDSNVTLNSITVSAVAVKGTNDIKTYYYSKDNGATYVTSTSNTYTFNNLLEGTEYKIKVKVEDTIAKFSTEFFKAITTRTYTLPSINSVTESNITSSSFNLRVNANQGTNAIRTYYYSKDNGGSYVTSSSNSYTFSGLSENTQYNVKVKVEDTNGRFSQISGKTITTLLTNFAQTLKNNYSSLGMDYHNGLANGANDGSYRFSGANPNNYVCFGPGATVAGNACPEENQYRIIGVFGNQVKLIKKTSLSSKVWNSSNVNTWAGSTMDT
ncbi:MAG: fibronectin type III domain-containing protein, partial [Clostridia bacterium]